jgi:pimeloyl-ACP methyl ester carboxylesterase
MGERIMLGGHPTWVEQRGDGAETVLVLHGGLSNSDMLLDAVSSSLEAHYRVVAFDRRGHGWTADTEAPFHYSDMTEETIRVLEQVVGGPAHLVGWSDGGIVALHVALSRPDLVRRLVVVGTNFHHDGMVPIDVDPTAPFFAMIAASYAERSPDGPDHFGAVVGKSLQMFATEPTLSLADVATITAPALVMVGDDDLISLSHTCALYEALPTAQLAVVPAASHALPMERPEETARIIVNFLRSELSATTMMPIRRGRDANAGRQ